MTGLKINMSNGIVGISTTESVDGFTASIQNAMVNIATRKGTARIYPDQGTSLLSEAVSGKIVGINDANHASQLAALDTLFFVRSGDTYDTEENKVGEIVMQPITYDGNLLRISATFINTPKTRSVGVTTNL